MNITHQSEMDEREAKRRRVDPEPPAPMELPELPDELWERIIDLAPLSAVMALKGFTKKTKRLAMADPRHASLNQVKTAVLATSMTPTSCLLWPVPLCLPNGVEWGTPRCGTSTYP